MKIYDSGHMVPYDKPQEMLTIINEFIEKS